jgi:FemAB-related protein (PEP-CTERM system-associated)
MNAYSSLAAVAVRTAGRADHDAIDAFVSQHSDAQLFHRPQWIAAVERGCRQRAHYLVAEQSGAIVGLLPLSERRSALFGAAMVSAGFGVGGGILSRSEAATEALASAAWRLAESFACPSVELRGGTLPEGWERREGVYADFVRELPADDDSILKLIPRRQRAEVRRGLASGLEIRIGRSPADLDTHYAVYAEAVRNHGTPVFPKALFSAMLHDFGQDADILSVWRDGRPLSTLFSFYFKDTVLPFWGGGTPEARGARANEVAYFELMRHAARRGCTRFDFGRSKVGTGPYAFKKHWGFEPRPLVYAVRSTVTGAGREMNPLHPKYRLRVALWRKLPLWAANRLGPPIARGLG